MVCGVGVGTYTFANHSGVSIEVTTPGTELACLYVDEMGANHANATGAPGYGMMTGRYWLIGGLQSGGTSDATGFEANLTLPHAGLTAPTVCRYTGGAGTGWDCAADGFNATTVWRNGVTAFSDWTVGQSMPTAVTLRRFSAGSRLNHKFLWGGLLALSAAAALIRKRR